jgi:hypothetical protein
MKKYYIAIAFLAASLGCFAQGKFSASLTNSGNTITFKVKPVGGNITAGLSTVEFFVRYPTTTAPFTYGTVTPNTTNFPNMTASGTLGSGSWEIERNNAAYALPGFNVDHFIYTAPAPVTASQTYINNTEYNMISVPLVGPTASVNLQFVHQDSEEKYYLAITSGVGADLRPAAFNSYFYPSTTTAAGPSGSTLYYMDLLNVPVPVKFNGFTATKRDNTALLNWSVENEGPVTSHYEIERSTNGVSFSKIARVEPKNNGATSNAYNLTDLNLTSVRTEGVIYYRIKQYDKDGQFVYSEIKSVRLDGKGFAISVYPNPVKDVATLTIDLVQDGDVIINITDAAGKQIKQLQVQGFKGLNTKKVDMLSMASGTYLFKISTGTELKTLSVVKGQ